MPQEHEIINNDVQEVMNKPPNWLISIGSTLVFVVVGITIFILSFVKIPQTASGPISISKRGDNGIVLIQIKIPEEKLASVKPGMETDLYLSSYPPERFGFLKGKLGLISDSINSDKTFNAQVVLQETIDTVNKRIILLNGMTGEGKVILGYTSFLFDLFK